MDAERNQGACSARPQLVLRLCIYRARRGHEPGNAGHERVTEKRMLPDETERVTLRTQLIVSTAAHPRC
jgi:hypothetical protein